MSEEVVIRSSRLGASVSWEANRNLNGRKADLDRWAFIGQAAALRTGSWRINGFGL